MATKIVVHVDTDGIAEAYVLTDDPSFLGAEVVYIAEDAYGTMDALPATIHRWNAMPSDVYATWKNGTGKRTVYGGGIGTGKKE